MSALLDLINFMKVFAVGPTGETEQISEEQREKVVASDQLTRNLESKLDEAQEDMEGRKAKYQEAKGKQGALGQTLGYLTETASGAAAQQRAEGTAASQPQGPVQSSPSGVATGKAAAFARQKGAKAAPLQGKVPSLSTQVRMQNPKPPKMATPQQMPGMKMEKEDEDGYNIKGRPQRNVQGQKDKSRMSKHGTGVRNLQQIIVDRAKKLEDKA